MNIDGYAKETADDTAAFHQDIKNLYGWALSMDFKGRGPSREYEETMRRIGRLLDKQSPGCTARADIQSLWQDCEDYE